MPYESRRPARRQGDRPRRLVPHDLETQPTHVALRDGNGTPDRPPARPPEKKNESYGSFASRPSSSPRAEIVERLLRRRIAECEIARANSAALIAPGCDRNVGPGSRPALHIESSESAP